MPTDRTDLGTYDPHAFEEKWYRWWEEKKFFHADPASPKPPFSIVIPPPNVTGSLHMGHALNNTLQDVLVRYKRMDGYEACWVPGTDHAGIATQNVVERMLAEEGKTRQDLGREAFIERVWEWREESGGTILRQLKRLGASCDWDRERFTMDEGLSRAVREVFCRLYEEGLIYRGDYIINWCPRCHTALSDLEVEHEEAAGRLWHIRYPAKDGGEGVVVATTRPETMLGDTAVAVHPEDERYRALVGKTLVLPIVGREIPVIADPAVDPEFGTGAVKVTPAHDPNDFAMGERHGLARVQVIGEDGTMTAEAGAYAGLDRYECRKRLVADLEAQGFLVKTDEHRHAVGHCYRCRTVIEPLVSRQWFVKIKPLAEKAIAAVREGRTRIVPPQWEKTYFHWMENIRDWCISRQIWWGHRIPAFTCQACGELTVARTDPEACPRCGATDLAQEEDVLDTWFSSALWPFSTLGWPEETPELAKFYPTSVLVTGFDILFFWVARMMMMGLWFRGDVPFHDVYIHALVRDEKGQKMSKSRGNVIDPLEVIDRFGADPFRFTLVAFAAQGRDIRLSVDRIEGYQRFANKVWNAVRFTLMNLEDFDPSAPAVPFAERLPQDRWILTRLREAVAEVRANLDAYEFDKAAGSVYQFLWHELCDWYIEMAKGPLYGRGDARARLGTQQTLVEAFDTVLRLLHPFMPFVTEELWQKLPWPAYRGERPESVMTAAFPRPEALPEDAEARDRIERVKEVVSAIRNIRGEMNVPPSRKVEAWVRGAGEALDVVRAEAATVRALAGLERLEVLEAGAARPAQSAAAVAAGLEIYVPLAGVVDLAAEEKRLEKEISRLDQDLGRVRKKLANPNFTGKAPAEVVEKERAKEAELAEKLEKLRANLERIRSAA
ncbi:MAG: valine--tRNA ligase [Candidatus Dadabacteria bacterium]|nr:MAG: valine--tRNA ligase [Candidatus Dadabacteria bacterium]